MLRNILFSTVIASVSLLMISCGTTSRMSKKKHVDYSNLSEKTGKTIEKGIASWYGPNFHGKLTANGEKYDMNGLTAAHRTLPFDTIVKVKNLDNGKSVIVRITDRGPFAKNRIIDLSKKAAQKIDMIGAGTAHVALVLMKGDLKNSRTKNLKIASYTVQLGSFREKKKAFAYSKKVDKSRVQIIKTSTNTFYRVYYGLYTDKKNARRMKQKLNKKGINGYVKQIEN